MRYLLYSLAILLPCLFLATSANANASTYAAITNLSPGSINIAAPGQEVPGNFVVRVTDSQGNPQQNVTVYFFTNFRGCLPLKPCTKPPIEMYGKFTNDSSEIMLTDANGVARSGRYFGGNVAGDYQVAGFVSYSASAINAALLQDGIDVDVLFAIHQFALTPPVSIPASGGFSLLLLVLGMVSMAYRRIRRAVRP